MCIDGKELGKDIDFPESIGFLLENPAFLDMYSGEDNLKLLAKVDSNVDKRGVENEIRGLIDDVGLGLAGRKKYKKYSLGMKQRLGDCGSSSWKSRYRSIRRADKCSG